MTPTLHFTADEFRAFAAPFLGEAVSRPWFGIHAALFLEIGRLTGTPRRSGDPSGEKHVSTGQAWTGVRPDGTTLERHEAGIKDWLLVELQDLQIEELVLTESEELSIRFTGGLCLTTMALEGDPEGDSEVDAQGSGPDRPEWELFDSSKSPQYFACE